MQIDKDLRDLADYIENVVTTFSNTMTDIQAKAYEIVGNELLNFHVENGHLTTQGVSAALVKLETKLDKLFGKGYNKSILSYLDDLGNIQDKTIDLHKTYNDLAKEIKALPETRKLVYNQAKLNFNRNSISSNYIQPVKNLLARQAIQGMTIKQSLSLIDKWNKGELSSGSLNQNQRAPNLNRYATQMARDTAYAMNRNTNDLIAKELELKGFRYVGGTVSDSRPLCRHLVGLRRKISLDELPPLIVQYPDGLYPNTTKSNFLQVNGGYNCRHISMPVRIDKA